MHCRAASVMLLEAWNLSNSDCIVAVAHRGTGSRYSHSFNTNSRSAVPYMAHCSSLLLESDWPMPACSDAPGLFFGSPKTEPNHSLFAAAWTNLPHPSVLRPHLRTASDVWINGDSFLVSSTTFNTSFDFFLLGFLKQKSSAWQVLYKFINVFEYLHCVGLLLSGQF